MHTAVNLGLEFMSFAFNAVLSTEHTNERRRLRRASERD